jgi:hypothetical protein
MDSRNVGPPNTDEAAIRAMLDQSRRDIAEGRVAPLGPVLDRLRGAAVSIRRDRTGKPGAAQCRPMA